MLIVGLCGGSGTGKSAAQAEFALCGIPGLDTDLVYHDLIVAGAPLTRALAERFGECILSPEGAIDRATLGALVFGDSSECEDRRRELNRITHSAVLDACRLWLDEQRRANAPAAIINAPLLFESGFSKECDLTVAILAPREQRIQRIVERDGISRDRAERRIASQLDDQFLIAHTDYQIENDGTCHALGEKVRQVAAAIKKISEETKNGK